jgi:hypothetical protein
MLLRNTTKHTKIPDGQSAETVSIKKLVRTIKYRNYWDYLVANVRIIY